MRYYLVWVRSIRYRGNEALTYQYDGNLAVGSIVHVPLKNERVLGIVIDSSKRPKFATKPVEDVLPIRPLPSQVLSLAGWVATFYPSSIGVVTSLVIPKEIRSRRIMIEETAKLATPLPPLTTEQAVAVRTIKNPDTYLLHGRTGSGKTRVYSEIARSVLSTSRSVLVLVPEIGLTSQLAANFEEQFPGKVVVLHSRQTAVQRQEVWLRIANSLQPLVVIGPRSALFSPLYSIGAIIIDEAHDQAYKQEQAPYYHALRVAAQLRALHNAILLLGSATPSVTDYYVAQQKQKSIITLHQLAKKSDYDKKITVVDLKDRSQFTRAPHISLPLAKAISAALERGEQALLYLNRRGTARVAL
ncbi:MAG: DEAD/DEAH box helicase, partial [Candidatus Micrarchaeaceae archaeon]